LDSSITYEFTVNNPVFVERLRSLAMQTRIYYEMQEFNQYREWVLSELGQEPN